MTLGCLGVGTRRALYSPTSSSTPSKSLATISTYIVSIADSSQWTQVAYRGVYNGMFYLPLRPFLYLILPLARRVVRLQGT